MFSLNVPCNLKECGYWWTELKEIASKEDNLKISYRAMRFSKEGPGWYSLNAKGPGGADFLESAMKSLVHWRPDFDLAAVALPELSDDFPLQAVKDALGNVIEYIMRPGATLVDVERMSVRVAGCGSDVLILRDRKKRRKTNCMPTRSLPRLRLLPRPPSPASVSESPSLAPAVVPVPLPASSSSSVQHPPEQQHAEATSSTAEWRPFIPAVPVAGVTASGIQISVPKFGNKDTKLPVVKLPTPEMPAQSQSDVPPFYQISLEQVKMLRSQQQLHVALGVEQVKFSGLPPLTDDAVKVAFCTTALRRPTVDMALKINLALTWKRRKNITWFVVDFNEGTELSDSLTEALEPAIRSGHLKLYRSKDLKFWHACIAKNTAHMLPDDSYHVLCNVDGDNLLTLEFVEQALVMAARMKSGEVGCTQFYGSGDAGTYGRIMIGRTLFHKLGGYDETFHPVGCQDTDLIYRALSCKNVGSTVRVDSSKMVGSSIDNKPGHGWSECIKEKVSNTDPNKYHKWKFGKMDQENRTRMYDLLQQGVVQRNVNHTIGVKAVLLELPEIVEESEEVDLADWSQDPSTASEDEADEKEDEAGGVTLHEDDHHEKKPLVAIAQKNQFRISTFGCQKLAMVERWHNTGANEMHEAWLPTKGRAPEPIVKNIINKALRQCWGVPDVIIDARCFRPPPRDWTDQHMGNSVTISQRLVEDSDTFNKMWSDALHQINSHAGGLTPVNITVFCRAGEKRSVSIAWLLSQALQKHAGWVMVEPVQHLCSRFWGRRTCAGIRCEECDLSSNRHHALVEKLKTYMSTDA